MEIQTTRFMPSVNGMNLEGGSGEPMELKEIQERVQAIRDVAGDAEAAHSLEDALLQDFIAYVATLPIPIAEKAKAVMATNAIDFERWCA